MSKKLFSFVLPDDLKVELKKNCRKEGETVAVIIRKVIRAYLRKPEGAENDCN